MNIPLQNNFVNNIHESNFVYDNNNNNQPIQSSNVYNNYNDYFSSVNDNNTIITAPYAFNNNYEQHLVNNDDSTSQLYYNSYSPLYIQNNVNDVNERNSIQNHPQSFYSSPHMNDLRFELPGYEIIIRPMSQT